MIPWVCAPSVAKNGSTQAIQKKIYSLTPKKFTVEDTRLFKLPLNVTKIASAPEETKKLLNVIKKMSEKYKELENVLELEYVWVYYGHTYYLYPTLLLVGLYADSAFMGNFGGFICGQVSFVTLTHTFID